MATIWIVTPEEVHFVGGLTHHEKTYVYFDVSPVADKSLDWCVKNLDVRRETFSGNPDMLEGKDMDELKIAWRTQRSGQPSSLLVIVQLHKGESTGTSYKGWKAGFYEASIKASEALRLLGK